ncbi:MAG: SiaB family protein kinase [Magnetospirillum sp. WYHS-4]
MRTDLYDLRNQLAERDIMICFAGAFSKTLIEELGNAVKRYMENEDATKTSTTDVLSVYIEQMQNIRNYTNKNLETDTDFLTANSSIVVIGRENERYVVSSGNIVLSEDVPALTGRIEHLRGLDKLELKALYKERLRTPRIDGGSAGLGLIHIARIATSPLEYLVRPVNDRQAFFSLRAVI